MMKYAIEGRDLVVRRGGARVIDEVDLAVPAGRITGLLGPSGCGKSTLIRAIVGVQQHVEGTLEVLGRPAGSAGLRRRVGYVTQAASVYDDLTVAENLRFFGRVLRVSAGRSAEVLDQVDLRGHRDHRVADLSGGQRSRVSLAVALLAEPELLVLDEPTVGLDPVLRRDLWRLFAELTAAGASILVSSHVMDEAERCHRLLLMRSGRFIAEGTPDEIRARTGADDIEQAFLRMVESGGAEARR